MPLNTLQATRQARPDRENLDVKAKPNLIQRGISTTPKTLKQIQMARKAIVTTMHESNLQGRHMRTSKAKKINKIPLIDWPTNDLKEAIISVHQGLIRKFHFSKSRDGRI